MSQQNPEMMEIPVNPAGVIDRYRRELQLMTDRAITAEEVASSLQQEKLEWLKEKTEMEAQAKLESVKEKRAS